MGAPDLQLKAGTSALLVVGNGVHPVVVGRVWPDGAFLEHPAPQLAEGDSFTLNLGAKGLVAGLVVQVFATNTSSSGYVVRLLHEASPVTKAAPVASTSSAHACDFDTLVVEDDRTCARLVAKWLQDTGRLVKTVGSGGEALGALHGDVDLVIVDSILPGMTGADLIRELRRRGCKAKIISVSGTATSAMAQSVVRMAGSDAFLAKPLRAEDLRAMVGNKTRLRGRLCRFRDS